jgi:hypothetical protein
MDSCDCRPRPRRWPRQTAAATLFGQVAAGAFGWERCWECDCISSGFEGYSLKVHTRGGVTGPCASQRRGESGRRVGLVSVSARVD